MTKAAPEFLARLNRATEAAGRGERQILIVNNPAEEREAKAQGWTDGSNVEEIAWRMAAKLLWPERQKEALLEHQDFGKWEN